MITMYILFILGVVHIFGNALRREGVDGIRRRVKGGEGGSANCYVTFGIQNSIQ